MPHEEPGFFFTTVLEVKTSIGNPVESFGHRSDLTWKNRIQDSSLTFLLIPFVLFHFKTGMIMQGEHAFITLKSMGWENRLCTVHEDETFWQKKKLFFKGGKKWCCRPKMSLYTVKRPPSGKSPKLLRSEGGAVRGQAECDYDEWLWLLSPGSLCTHTPRSFCTSAKAKRRRHAD